MSAIMSSNIEKEIKNLIKEKYPQMNPVFSKKEDARSLRITQNANKNFIDNLFGGEIKRELTNSSATYYTLFYKYKSKEFKAILSLGDLKINTKLGKVLKNKDKIVQKQLTPSNLNIKLEYSNKFNLIEDIINGLKLIKIEDDIFNLLLSLMKIASNEKNKLNEQEAKLYKENYKSINKDFGELLVGINYLTKEETKKIEFPNNSNEPLFDIKVTDKLGFKKELNVKSEAGSGQSFKTIPIEYINFVINKNLFDKNSTIDNYLQIMKIFHDKNKKGLEKHKEVFQILSKEDNRLSRLLKEFDCKFFKGDGLFEGLKVSSMSYSEYKNEVNKILIKNNIQEDIGIPIGNKNKPIEERFKEKDFDLNNVLIFTLSTLVSREHNQKIFNRIVNEMLTNTVLAVIIKKSPSNNNFIIEENKNPEYKIHYWGNSSKPVNNLLGYKII